MNDTINLVRSVGSCKSYHTHTDTHSSFIQFSELFSKSLIYIWGFDLVLIISLVLKNNLIFGQEVTNEVIPAPGADFFDHSNISHPILLEDREQI